MIGIMILVWMLGMGFLANRKTDGQIYFIWNLLGFIDSIAVAAGVVLSILFALATIIFGVLSLLNLRYRLVTKRAFSSLKTSIPGMSETEREALEAGTVWWEAELFGG